MNLEQLSVHPCQFTTYPVLTVLPVLGKCVRNQGAFIN